MNDKNHITNFTCFIIVLKIRNLTKKFIIRMTKKINKFMHNSDETKQDSNSARNSIACHPLAPDETPPLSGTIWPSRHPRCLEVS